MNVKKGENVIAKRKGSKTGRRGKVLKFAGRTKHGKAERSHTVENWRIVEEMQ